MRSLHLVDETRGPSAPRFAFWELGFRPFYLLASVFAALSIPLWALQFSGVLGHAYLAGPIWHAHEMLFGFALAVIVGFLFTAGRNWTDQATPRGLALAALAALWLAARVLVLTPFGWAAAAANVAFPLAAGDRPGDSLRPGAQPSQLLLRRPADADGRGRRGRPPGAARGDWRSRPGPGCSSAWTSCSSPCA